jgi:hypothetical protein
MKRTVIHNSDYQSEEEMKTAISKHFVQRNNFFMCNPKRAGKTIWEIDFFKDYNHIRCQTQHYLQMPVVFAKLSANMATLCANGSASLCGELRGGRELGANMSRSKAPFKDMDSAIICGW